MCLRAHHNYTNKKINHPNNNTPQTINSSNKYCATINIGTNNVQNTHYLTSQSPRKPICESSTSIKKAIFNNILDFVEDNDMAEVVLPTLETRGPYNTLQNKCKESFEKGKLRARQYK